MNFVGGVLSTVKPRLDDSGSDRLNYYYSTVTIMVISVTITAKQYVGTPLQCWVPAQFTKAWEQYAENYCFVYNTYWVRPDGDVPVTVEERIAQQLIYYQWVPFIMALEALFFYLPAAVWGILSRRSGLNIESIVKTATKADDGKEEEERKKNIGIICNHFSDYMKLQRARSEGATFVQHVLKFGLLDGSYISNCYMVIKCLYIANLIGQFLMMNQFLGQHNHLWGATILSDIISGSNWEDTGNFPRIAMCDFQVRVLGNMQRYSIQCVLVLNMFNEKIFLFLYWWFIVVYMFTVVDFVQLGMNTRIRRKKEEYVRKYIKVSPDDDELLSKFCASKVNPDMVIMLNMISNHASEIITTEILESLWVEYSKPTKDEELDGSNGSEEKQIISYS